jgi:hypothetical protein
MGHKIEVPESKSNLCPYCGYDHDPTEGSSEMHEGGICVIWCASCGGQYWYKETERRGNG